MQAEEDDGRVLEKVEASFRVEMGGAWEEWEVAEFRVNESISEPYYGVVEISRKSRDEDYAKWLGRSCFLELRRGYDRRRYFKGLVFRVECLEAEDGYDVALVEFGAALAALAQGEDSQIFENRTAPEVIDEVLKEGLERFGRKARLSLSRTYARREYCVQWKESDLNFVRRLMADEGLGFYFDQGADAKGDKETLVIVDNNDAYPEIETMGSVQEVEPLQDIPSSATNDATKADFRARIIDDATGEPMPRVKIGIRLADGSIRNLVSGGDGLVEVLDVEPGSHTLNGAAAGATVRDVLEVVALGESSEANGAASGVSASKGPGKTTRRHTADASTGPSSYNLVVIEQHRVKTGETLEKIAAQYDLSRATLAHFNWGVYSPEEVEEKLRDELGCTQKDANGRYLLTDDADPGLLFIPKAWSESGLSTGEQHTVRVRAPEEGLQDLVLELQYDPDDPPEESVKGGTLILETEDGSWTHELPIGALSEVQPHVLKASFPAPPVGCRLGLILDLNDGRERVDLFADVDASTEESLVLIPRSFPARLLRGKKFLRVRALPNHSKLDLPPQKSLGLLAYEEPVRVSEPIADLTLSPGAIVFPPRTAGGAYPVFEVGPPMHPEINHDHGFLDNHADRADFTHPGKCYLDNSKRREPTWEDRKKLARWRIALGLAEAGHVTPAALVPKSIAEEANLARELKDGLPAYHHFQYGDGKPRAVDYESFLAAKDDGYVKGDASGAKILDSAIEDTRAAAIELDEMQFPGSPGRRRFEMRSQVITVCKENPRYPYPVTQNWQKAIGGHPIWITAAVEVDADPATKRRDFRVMMRIHAEDMYNFDPGKRDIATGILDDANGLFEITGLANEYLNTGEANRTISFSVSLDPAPDKRMRPGDESIVGGNEAR